MEIGRLTLALVAVLAFGCSAPSGNALPPAPPSSAPPPQAPAPAHKAEPAPSVSPADAKEETPAVLTCENVRRRKVPGICGVLEKAPRGKATDSAVKRTIATWRRLEGPFRALSGRESALVVLSPDARMGKGKDAKPLPPAAFICPGAPPTVYVPGSLLAMLGDEKSTGGTSKKYPEDFLAFVIGHELAHRMNDLTPDGCQLAAFQRPGKGMHEEELADARAAFFMTNAGYSASHIARKDLVTGFLEAEFELGRAQSKGRRDSLLAALSSFDAYEALYQAGLSVALTGEMEAADRLLSWTDELLQSQGVPLPEVRVVRAITRINRAAKMAPWSGELALPVGISHLRCTPLHPGHSGLWEEPHKRVRGPDMERGRRLLKQALRLLEQAEELGATSFTVAAARACASLYLADASAAKEAQDRAESTRPKTATAAVTRTLANNRALIAFLDYVKKHPVPSNDNDDELRSWASKLSSALGGERAPAGLATVFRALADPDDDTAAPTASAPSCRNANVPKPAAMAKLPQPGKTHGQCPSGFRLAHALPSLEAAKRTGSGQGMTECGPTPADGSKLVTVRLTATTDPPLEELERTMLSSRPPQVLRELDAWACHCTSLRRQGVSDSGDIVYRARCPQLGVARGALVVAGDQVKAVIQHSR